MTAAEDGAAFQDPERVRALATAIAQAVRPGKRYRFMEFCGGHTHAIGRYGLAGLLPEAVTLIHGPGCPVCVLPAGRIDAALALAARPEVILCSYGDLFRVPGSARRSMISARAEGADIRMVTSPLQAVTIARDNPQRAVVFFAIGFETTAPASAAAIKAALAAGLTNFHELVCHVLTPPAMATILAEEEAAATDARPRLDGLIGPGHVALITGMAPFDRFAQSTGRPIAVAGFEPTDLLQAVLALVTLTNEGAARAVNRYTRAVTEAGNTTAQALLQEVFEVKASAEWRGLGMVADSALALRPAYAHFDAEKRFPCDLPPPQVNRACRCPDILRGLIDPEDCALFGRGCTPSDPVGACMVSSEGACAAAYAYGGRRAATPLRRSQP
ncbi:hydrogenase formation protein HypD [Rhodospirillum rubrum]|uniref:hydrogenase formation protein HypD n=1 Tax=Rhodospirillum rubrum TaxID=1085 RepID=UPI0019089DFE|nr:hydrogenase formation protein HypD [Rhodospirillum rubrum]MBK1664837.1 hydrogenase formation protein HypD [Rhodospirillum rubrum]MBK1677117.1 hydrogenase formation protein HypD [Rhodospirillum rubrum]